MLEEYMNSVKGTIATDVDDVAEEIALAAVEKVDKETNTECAFLPEKGRRRLHDPARSSNGTIDENAVIDDRLVKRSQTFSPR